MRTFEKPKPYVPIWYYYFHDNLKVDICQWANTGIDNDRFNAGNCFTSESEAKKAVKAIKELLK